MFLAWNEIKYSKTRFALIIGVMVLVSYLVYFLTGLAYGLAQDNRTAIDKWDATAIVLTDEANGNINMSMMGNSLRDAIDAEELAMLGTTPNVVRPKDSNNEDDKISVNFFGVHPDEFLIPELIEGKAVTEDHQVVADISMKEEFGVALGDELNLAGSDLTVKVVGFTENAKFSVSPVLYTTIPTYQEIRFEEQDQSPAGRISAFVVRDDNLNQVTLEDDSLRLYTIEDYVQELPGYMAQVLTFALMIGFLIVIAAVVIGIFMYVLTVQKASLFGVMKAQGISTRYIALSVLAQTLILAVLGVGIGLLLTVATAFFLPSTVPFMANPYFMLIISGLMIVFALLGAFFSVRTVAKIDPLEAIG
ncbi:FtsX-like permease family protein [Aerococcaceae bacterium WS4759]|uniref:Putative hemin transport system permease protein HrtB n=1 Tax=Fundicoccus ignavus TaxID=2664442 RepID=A0A6I2GDR2_9LACT|nr:ABC transporter permease [Fundicoccus ignavus]MRI85947.1 FtsX-like permease family protein [Fundicoccus ignavus]